MICYIKFIPNKGIHYLIDKFVNFNSILVNCYLIIIIFIVINLNNYHILKLNIFSTYYMIFKIK